MSCLCELRISWLDAGGRTTTGLICNQGVFEHKTQRNKYSNLGLVFGPSCIWIKMFVTYKDVFDMLAFVFLNPDLIFIKYIKRF